MASIYKRGSIWWGRVRRQGREFREPLKTTSRAVAEKRLKDWIARMDAIAWGDKPRRTFDEMALGFLDDHAKNLRPQSLRRYETSLKALTPHFEGLTLDQITRATLAAYEADRRRLVSAPTVRRDLACLSSMFTWAIAWEWCEVNPVSPFLKARSKRGLKEAPARTRYLSHEEEARLLAAAPSYLEPMIAVAIDTGLRLEEQLSLTWDQVNLAAREIRVERTKSGEPRTVPILPRAGTILGTLPRHIHSRYVFCKSDGTRYGKLTRGLAAAVKRAGIATLQWHDLRRTCGCRLQQDHGFKLDRIREWLGHASVVQTERAYAFLRVEDLHAAIDAGTKTGTRHADS
jgi:integrase